MKAEMEAEMEGEWRRREERARREGYVAGKEDAEEKARRAEAAFEEQVRRGQALQKLRSLDRDFEFDHSASVDASLPLPAGLSHSHSQSQSHGRRR